MSEEKWHIEKKFHFSSTKKRDFLVKHVGRPTDRATKRWIDVMEPI